MTYVRTYNTVNVEVKQQRATTDESLRLLHEMDTKIKQSILDTIVINSNALKAVAIFFRGASIMDGGGVEFIARFTINGKEYDTKGKCPLHDFETTREHWGWQADEIILKEWHKILASAIADELVKHPIQLR